MSDFKTNAPNSTLTGAPPETPLRSADADAVRWISWVLLLRGGEGGRGTEGERGGGMGEKGRKGEGKEMDAPFSNS